MCVLAIVEHGNVIRSISHVQEIQWPLFKITALSYLHGKFVGFRAGSHMRLTRFRLSFICFSHALTDSYMQFLVLAP